MFISLLFQNNQQIFKLGNHLLDHLFELGTVIFGVVTRQTQARTADGETLIIEQRTNLPNHQHILTLIITAIAAALDWVELGKLLLPIAQYVGFYRAKLTHFTDGEIALARYCREFVVMTGFQHMLQLWLLVFARGEKLLHGEP